MLSAKVYRLTFGQRVSVYALVIGSEVTKIRVLDHKTHVIYDNFKLETYVQLIGRFYSAISSGSLPISRFAVNADAIQNLPYFRYQSQKSARPLELKFANGRGTHSMVIGNSCQSTST